ncbi:MULTISPECIES: DUF1571 domain-containing protein [Paraburkholderia]|uniref:DUF1571 domain-containing protein n=1 Tax=Paraburkholderia TaxID=1822464 RepID=UPI00225057AF|nr:MULTISPECIES: DUF1571 domain-containing protein [Paraburkholderia]MCX4163486.1 DUF1571 domain-containing protein [Paraburkholderia megapolitana]MDN7158981.1 DUF1571 domain-containing protein [Paraburkholderia sp. CHISQ3]MDQ6496028.1 DUF1571 domain-containing protein [Paraburkholderia megapolitana]
MSTSRNSLVARTLLCALAGLCLIVSTGTFAQEIDPISPALSSTSAECTHVVAADSASADVDRFRCLTAGEQAASWRTRIEDRSLLSLPDNQILALMDAMKPEAFVEYARFDMILDNAYEYTMFRRERVFGRWSARPDHMIVRYQDNPRKVYVKWLPDGAHAGQEILYDETTDPDSVYGHVGGPLRIVSGKVAIDGPFALAQSRHSVRDIGLQFVARTIEHDARSFRAEGLTEKPVRIELVNVQGARMLAWTWIAASGPPAHYAQRVRLLFDLQHPWPIGEAAWDAHGELLEMIHFEDVVPRHWSESTFDRRNAEYGFR